MTAMPGGDPNPAMLGTAPERVNQEGNGGTEIYMLLHVT